MRHWIITVFSCKLFIILFKDKVSEFIDCHLFYSAGYIWNVHDVIRKARGKRKSYIDKKIEMEIGVNKQFIEIWFAQSLILRVTTILLG